jgi:hypothetical protein
MIYEQYINQIINAVLSFLVDIDLLEEGVSNQLYAFDKFH